MYKNNKNARFSLITMLLSGWLLSACSANINMNNPDISINPDNASVARVYFIRPQMEKYKGIADHTLTVKLNNQPLFTIDEGQYIMVRLNPGKDIISTHSLTKFVNRRQPLPVSRQREYTFAAGNVYFIHLKRLNEEFRGIFYDPAPVDWDTAVSLTRDASPHGDARNARIETVSEDASSNSVPAGGHLPPAVPEQIYPQQPYMLKLPVVPIDPDKEGK